VDQSGVGVESIVIHYWQEKRGFGELEGMLAVEGLEVTIKGGLVQVWRDERSEFKIFIGCNAKTASVR